MWIVGIVVLVGWIGSVCLHEFGHALVAYLGGDTSVKDKGYLTFNPTKYIDPQMSLVLPVIFLLLGGIALPGAAVYINDGALRNRAWRSAVSAAGPMASAIAALLLSIPFWFGVPIEVNFAETAGGTLRGQVWMALALLCFLNIYMVFINSLPIPPLDGFGVLRPWLPPKLQAQANRIGKYGILVLFGLIFFVPLFGQILTLSTFALVRPLGIPDVAIVAGYRSFRAGSIPIVVGAIALFIVYQRWLKPPYKRSLDQGNLHLRTGRYDAALEAFDQSLTLQPDCYDAFHGKGLALSALNRDHEALDAYDSAIALDGNRLEAHQQRAEALTRLHRIADAIATHERLEQLDPSNPDHKLTALFLAGRYSEAIAFYDQLLEQRSADSVSGAALWLNKAFCYSKLHDIDNTLHCLRHAIALDASTRETARTLPSLMSLQDHPSIHTLLVNLTPTSGSIGLRRYLADCQQLLRQGKYQEAVTQLEEAIALNPDLYEAHYLHALALECLERHDAALDAYDRAIALQPDAPEPQERRANLLKQHG